MPIDGLLGDASFDPELTAVLSSAFDIAWARIERSGSPLAADGQADVAREQLAKYIIAAARSGERDQNRLVDDALSRLAEHSKTRPPADDRYRST